MIGITEAFKACTNPSKLNLGVGVYRTEELQPSVLSVVRKVRPKPLRPKCTPHFHVTLFVSAHELMKRAVSPFVA